MRIGVVLHPAVASLSRASRPQRVAAASGAKSATPWTVAPNILTVKGSLAGKDSVSSSHAICSTPCEREN